MSQAIDNNEQSIETLKNRSDFLRVASTRKKWITPAMIVQIAPRFDQESDSIKVGYTASKKVGNAVARSLAKRRMREVVKQVMKACAPENHDYVMIARREILEYPFDQLIRDLKWALKRLHGTERQERADT